MRVIGTFKGDLKNPKEIYIGAVYNYGAVKTTSASDVYLVARDVIFPNEIQPKDENFELNTVIITLEYGKELMLNTVKIWAPEASSMANEHVKAREARYDEQSIAKQIVDKWNELYPEKRATINSVGTLFIQEKINLEDFKKEHKIEAKPEVTVLAVTTQVGGVSIV